MGINFSNSKRLKSNHTRPQAPAISLEQPGRLRVANVLALLGISHSTLYAGLSSGRYPKPDGYDGNLPYWTTETIRQFCSVHRERSTPKANRKAPTAPPPNILELLEQRTKR